MLLWFTLLLGRTTASSAGTDTGCSLGGTWGCTSWELNADDPTIVNRLACLDATPGTMQWVAAPVRSDKYSVRSGDGSPASDAGSYYPDEYMSIYVRALDYDFKFRGIMIYAVDESGATVGEWDNVKDSNARFWTPCENKGVLLHVSAEVKPGKNRLRWKAPADGTGTVTFRAMVKRGPANHGWFYYPNLAGDLSLSQAAPRSGDSTSWVQGYAGNSCDEACASWSGTCVEANMADINSLLLFESKLSPEFNCRYPIVSSCKESAPGMSLAGQCSYHDSSCDAWREQAAPTCAANILETHRFCPCEGTSETRSPTGGPTTAPTEGAPDLSAAFSTTHSSLLVAGLALVSFLSLSSSVTPQASSGFSGRMLLCVCVLFSVLAPCQAHNWLHTPGRASKQASTNRPCMARKDTDLHAQIQSGQQFAYKWATGHSRPSTIAVIHSEDIEWLGHPDFLSMVEEYIADAPSNAHLGTATRRYHGPKDGTTDLSFYNQHTELYEGEVSATTVSHPRSPHSSLFKYTDTAIADDKRVSYQSEKFPWLESVFQYEHLYHLPSDFDAINMTVPARKGPGHYIVAWRWNGYYDCTDVDVRAEKVAEIYGVDLGEFVMNKVDHCQYVDVDEVYTSCLDATLGVNQCTDMLTTSTSRPRQGVNVVPMTNPSTVFPGWAAEVNIPWTHQECANTPWLLLEGVETTSTPDWAAWQGKRTLRTGWTCGTTLWTQTSTLSEAILRCSADNCLALAWPATAGDLPSDGVFAFKGCSDSTGTQDALENLAVKLAFAVPTLTPADTISVSFSRDDAVYTPPAGWLIAGQEIFGDAKGQGVAMGSRCPRPSGRFGFIDGTDTTHQKSYMHISRSSNWDWCDDARTEGNFWEIAVEPGVYEVTTYQNRAPSAGGDLELKDCAWENVQVTEASAVVDKYSATKKKTVEVLDGRLTMSGHAHYMKTGSNQCDYFATVVIDKVANQLAPVWLPSTADPWWQIQLPASTRIGLVTVTNRDRATDPGAHWLYRGDRWETGGAPIDEFRDAQNEGYIVGVSDNSCTGSGCSGTVCKHVMKTYWEQDWDVVSCDGKRGSYVYVTLPGANRILSPLSITVNRAEPDVPAGTKVCYGVVPRPATSTAPEYIVTEDPEDPKFYSTCYVRELAIEWLGEPPSPPPASWRFNGECLTCDSYNQTQQQASAEHFPSPHWVLSDKCIDCDEEMAPDTNVYPPEPRQTHAGMRCDDNTRNTCNKEVGYCAKVITRLDGYAVTTMTQCQGLMAADAECSDRMIWRNNTSSNPLTTPRCRCYRAEACCVDCTPVGSSSYDLFTTTHPPPISECTSPHLLSADGSLCCAATCIDNTGAEQCGTTSCRSTSREVRGTCCNEGLLTSCSESGPPCLM